MHTQSPHPRLAPATPPVPSAPTHALPGAQGTGQAPTLPPEVAGVAITTVDTAGITRVKAVPAARLIRAGQDGVGLSPVFDVALVDDSFTNSPHIGGPEGDLRIVPDLSALTVLAGQPGWAWAPGDRYEQSGSPAAACHRAFLRRVTTRAEAAGLSPLMGFETEWIVTVPADGGGHGGTADAEAEPCPPAAGGAYGMTRLAPHGDYLRDILVALERQGVEVLQIHPEYSPGQFELSVAPAAPVRAADLVVLVQETIRAVTVRYGWETNFGPSVLAGQVGNGRHLHLSLWRDGVNLCGGGEGPAGLRPEAESFLAGVLGELPALLAIGAPSPASYLRLAPSRWTGAFQCWGPENREAALRLIPGAPGRAETANAEVKCLDAAASPYLVAGAVLAAGLGGLERGERLPAPVTGDPAELPETERPERLPASLPEAVARFRQSEALRAALGDPLFEAITKVREAETELFAGYSPQALANATRRAY
ncbi:glutamine synthetase family protein [Streptomyces sp. SPB074]|uniref:glutamine synthetase family protein n=1 Tax=Streptomyces sp. (strain SPB074) TaxID=465543 RepID=UPI0001D1E137|nr:glutamine synthetase family protein [Streptomyces sp. SPB074]EFG65114.1 glutamine synthetase [Streptomyces sp. SPB074]